MSIFLWARLGLLLCSAVRGSGDVPKCHWSGPVGLGQEVFKISRARSGRVKDFSNFAGLVGSGWIRRFSNLTGPQNFRLDCFFLGCAKALFWPSPILGVKDRDRGNGNFGGISRPRSGGRSAMVPVGSCCALRLVGIVVTQTPTIVSPPPPLSIHMQVRLTSGS